MDLSLKHNTLQALWDNSALDIGNAAYLEQLYEDYLASNEQLDPIWRSFFDRLPQNLQQQEISHSLIREQFRQKLRSAGISTEADSARETHYDTQQVRVLQFINAYRFLGHQIARTDPLQFTQTSKIAELGLEYYGFTAQTLQKTFQTGSLTGSESASLQQIITTLELTYAGSVGAEYMHSSNINEKRWIQNFLESRRGIPNYSNDIKMQLLQQMIAAEGLEKYLHSKYVGQKRFSLEGSESLIPLLKGLIKRGGGKHGIKEIAIGMAHRGRLNVLVNIMGKTPADMFREFEGNVEQQNGTGDVKYHMGFSSDLRTDSGSVHVALAFNPSHLEIIAPVVEGSVRARQDRRKDKNGQFVIPVIIHGDAAFAGQGVVMETFNMSQSRGYSTKGTIHIVVNNQIGFTTSIQEDARSTLYCTDVAKMVNAPIFHVNGDDPEAVLLVAQLALDYRMKFFKDVVIDLVCYRRHGHSEADEPMVTQPMMYQRIRSMPTALQLYSAKLIEQTVLTESEFKQQLDHYRRLLDAGQSVVSDLTNGQHSAYPYIADWSQYKKCANNGAMSMDVETAVDHTTLVYLYNKANKKPQDFVLHRNVEKILASRDKMITAKIPLDWGFAETMAYATLLNDKFSIRLSGQDSGRGTFFHRHAILHNQKDTSVHIPLRNLNTKQSKFLVINSLLSEEAVLAFEYGYATTDPQTMVIWEAQFGDFANNAQVVIDQFICAGEQKWNRLCGLVMFLPHGFEGQGPEHSSARLERYLQLCAQHNIQVCIPTNAAQIFHLLRRQMLMNCRRPLIVMTPKSLLRLPAAMSDIEQLSNGKFKTVIDEIDTLDNESVNRLIFCSGKVYYDLVAQRHKNSQFDVAIIRVEQLYPFPEKCFKSVIINYPNATSFVWCQEEPMNQGAWYSSQHHIRHALGKKYYLQYAGRRLLAAPAAGYPKLHIDEQKKLIKEALGI